MTATRAWHNHTTMFGHNDELPFPTTAHAHVRTELHCHMKVRLAFCGFREPPAHFQCLRCFPRLREAHHPCVVEAIRLIRSYLRWVGYSCFKHNIVAAGRSQQRRPVPQENAKPPNPTPRTQLLIYLSIYLPIYMSICLPIYLSVYL